MKADNIYDRQFLAWSVDRALRMFEVQGRKDFTLEDVSQVSRDLCEFMMPAPDAVEPEVEKSPEELAAEAEHDKHIAAAQGNA